jgi:hypothetical protein
MLNRPNRKGHACNRGWFLNKFNGIAAGRFSGWPYTEVMKIHL